MATPLTINHIDQLSQIHDQSAPAVVIHNAECIFKSNHVDVTKILDQRTPTNLMKVRGSQLKKVEELFPKYRSEFAHKRTNRDSKEYLVQDILLLGNTIANNSPDAKLNELVYSIPEDTDEVDSRNVSDPKVLENTIKELLKITKH